MPTVDNILLISSVDHGSFEGGHDDTNGILGYIQVFGAFPRGYYDDNWGPIGSGRHSGYDHGPIDLTDLYAKNDAVETDPDFDGHWWCTIVGVESGLSGADGDLDLYKDVDISAYPIGTVFTFDGYLCQIFSNSPDHNTVGGTDYQKEAEAKLQLLNSSHTVLNETSTGMEQPNSVYNVSDPTTPLWGSIPIWKAFPTTTITKTSLSEVYFRLRYHQRYYNCGVGFDACKVSSAYTPPDIEPPPITGDGSDNKLSIHPYNLIADPNVELTASDEDSEGLVSNLRNFLLSRKWIAGTNSANFVINCSAVDQGIKHCDHIIVEGSNLLAGDIITVESDADGSFSSPVFTEVLVVPDNPDYNNTLWNELGNTPQTYRTLFFPFEDDILLAAAFIRVTIDSAVDFFISNCNLGWSLQYDINYHYGNTNAYIDNSSFMQSFSRRSYQDKKKVSNQLKFDYPYHNKHDKAITRFLTRELAGKQFYISAEPTRSAAIIEKDGIRQHTMTYLVRFNGNVQIKDIDTNMVSNTLLFEQAIRN